MDKPGDEQPDATSSRGATTAPGGADSVRGAFVQARPRDPMALRIIHARVSGALFGAETSAGLGRFRVLERLGAGAMGVVYAAYDPDLDRGVALKMVRVTPGDRGAALAEAKALARLSHPHVVPIYDVGIEDDHVYIVMELVRGETLRVWARGVDRHALLRGYCQAGEALAAAHAAGLVHRDFKPDNAIIGRDGRVRVVDFGLARDAADPSVTSEQPHLIAGTPRYMAPEQARGAPATPTADQYSFCVALEEALSDASAGSPLPRWIADALARGQATAPADRFASMSELLRALDRDPARLRRRRIVIGAAVALGALAFVAGRAVPSSAPDPCSGGEAALAETWAPAARSAALARIEATGTYGRALVPLVRQMVDQHDRRWVDGQRAACVAHHRGAQSASLYDRRLACLERRRAALATVAELADHATISTLPELALAARALPDPAACADVDALVGEVEPPPPEIATRLAPIRADLERARILIAAGRASDAHAIAVRASQQARPLGYAPALAEAMLVRGHAAMTLPDRAEAVASLVEATDLGLAAGGNAVAIEAWARRAWMRGMVGDAAAIDGLAVIDALARRRDASPFVRALLHNNVGSVELARSHRAEARAAFERALGEARAVSGPGAVELVAIRGNLALVADEPSQRDALLEGVDAELTRLLGDGHPRVLEARLQRGITGLPRPTDALAVLVPTCDQLEQHTDRAASAVRCWTEVAFLRGELDDIAGAVIASEHAVAHLAAAPHTVEAAPYLAFWRGDAAGAIDAFTRALADVPTSDDAPLGARIKRAELLLGLGRARRAAGDRDASATLRSAVAALEAIDSTHPHSKAQRRLVRARAELAASPGQPRR